ncbi:MAG TPA: ABC transporter ATP-binding protein [Gammaproteobacteria bacterium]|nr:ABC transporter ATP-binding protein [Gammaproteobacteria bacterium]
MTDQPLLVARDLNTYYGASHILHGISLSIKPGETVSLMGRNGMGKTTTIRSLLGLTAPRTGTVQIRGQEVAGWPAYKIARLGLALVPEGRGIFPNLTVYENLLMSARPGLKGSREWTLEGIAALFPRLVERKTNMGNQLSGGEQQMLSIGRALMTNPDLLILDEATEGLAPLIRKEIWSVIRKINMTGMATLIVDKDITSLLKISDHCVLINKGKVVYNDSASHLAANPEVYQKYVGV